MWGVATSEDIASDGRILSYEASKAAFKEWFGRCAGFGGNLRAQPHDKGEPVGRAFMYEPDDNARQIVVGCRISRGAEDAWQKVLDGTYRGFSIGGAIRKKEAKIVRSANGGERAVPFVTAYDVDELILCDEPSDPKATYTMIHRSADGKTVIDDAIDTGDLSLSADMNASIQQSYLELRKEALLQERKHLDSLERAKLSDAERDKLPDSAFAYIDSEGGRHLPIHDEAHIKAAMGGDGWTAQSFESDAKKTAAAKKIIAAAKKEGMEVDPKSAVAEAAGVSDEEKEKAQRAAEAVAETPEDELARAAAVEGAEAETPKAPKRQMEGLAGHTADAKHTDKSGSESPSTASAEGGEADDKVKRAAEFKEKAEELLARAVSKADEMQDADLAQRAIEMVRKLLQREATEVAEGETDDLYDVECIAYILDQLVCFQQREAVEAAVMERSAAAADGEPIEQLRKTIEDLTAKVEEATNLARSATEAAEAAKATAESANTASADALERANAINADDVLKRAKNDAQEDLDEIKRRLEAVENAEVTGGPVSMQTIPLDKLLPGDRDATPEELGRAFTALRKQGLPSDAIDTLEAQAAIRAIHSQGARPLAGMPA